MSTQSTDYARQLREELRTQGYCASIQQRYCGHGGRFLNFLTHRSISIQSVREDEIERFVRWELHRFRLRHRRAPQDLPQWRGLRARVARRILRLVHGCWPLEAEPVNALEAFHRDLTKRFDIWMREMRGLAPRSRSTYVLQATGFLSALGSRADRQGLRQMSVQDIDAYVQQRCIGLRRASIANCTGALRVFLRYLHGCGHTAHDLSATVLKPHIYESEHIASALRAEEVQRVLDVTRQDRSATGRRDYAFLLLLATYGLRAMELQALRLEDIDWKKEVIRVRHGKTGAYTELPLLRAPGEALLRYLRHGRGACADREVFLRARAPRGALKDVHGIVAFRLKVAGITPVGRKGLHAFRHARAVSLLRSGVTLKTIGDVLGHRCAGSTAVYLKLATQDLRAVGLERPEGGTP